MHSWHAERMMRMRVWSVVAAALMAGGTMGFAQQEKGSWRAESNTARSITGDVALAEEKISINFVSFTMARQRGLSAAEISSLFESEGGSGSLYRLDIPASRRFLKKNTLCGGSDVQWMAAYVVRKELRLAFFSGGKAPLITAEGLANSTDL